jgi:hypothetical protein
VARGGAPKAFGPFLDVETANGVTLAILETGEKFEPQHYAFLVSDAEFDAIFGRVKARGLAYWADPAKRLAVLGPAQAAAGTAAPAPFRTGGWRSSISHCSVKAVRPITMSAAQPTS